MRLLMWDVRDSYTDSLVAGPHDYLFLNTTVPRRSAGRYPLDRDHPARHRSPSLAQRSDEALHRD